MIAILVFVLTILMCAGLVILAEFGRWQNEPVRQAIADAERQYRDVHIKAMELELGIHDR